MSTSDSRHLQSLECLCVKALTPKVCLDAVTFSVYYDPNGELTQNEGETYTISLDSGIDVQDVGVHDTATITHDGQTYSYIVTKIDSSIITIDYVSSTNDLDVPVEGLCSGEDCTPSIIFCRDQVRSSGGIVRARIVCDPACIRVKTVSAGCLQKSGTTTRPRIVYVKTFPKSATTTYTEPISFTTTSSHCDPTSPVLEEGVYVGILGLHTETIYVGDAATIEYNSDTYTYLVTNVDGNSIDIKFVSSTSGLDTPVEELCTLGTNPITGENEGTCLPYIVFSHTTYQINPQLEGVGSLSSVLSVDNLIGNNNAPYTPIRLSASGQINVGLTADYNVIQHAEMHGLLNPTYIDKFAGDFGDFECLQKLYPSGDLALDADMGHFVGPYNQSGNLYTFIDEGIFTGDYHKPSGQSTLLSDDQNSFIHPDTIHTDGLFQYKCNLTNFRVRPEHTRFRIRASAPIRNYEARVPPKYTISEIKFQDPLGNLLVQYDDIIIKGDAVYKDVIYVNYGTYSSNAQTNKTTELYDWRRDTPLMHQISGYQLSFNVKSEALDDAFDTGFSDGFEEDFILHETYASGDDYLALDGGPLATQDQSLINPTRGLRISAIEICNSGGYGPRLEHYINLYSEVETTGNRIERKILPSFMPLFNFDTGIYPSVSSIWYYNDDSDVSNLDSCGSEKIVKGLREDTGNQYATLNSVGPHLDSGKLTLKFSHHPTQMNQITKGAFHCGFDQSICSIWTDPSGAFNTQNRPALEPDDGFFAIEAITLKVKAKKATDSRDYVLDVVGYSDDKLLNITSASGGFLQNPSGVGAHPTVSGFAGVDDLGISSESISEKENYFTTSGNLGGDHYSLVHGPVVSQTTFTDYEIPLKIVDDRVAIGKSRDYSMSSLFEHLYMDIYPIPSGASIASAYLLVRYAPQNALNLSVDGGESIRKIQDGRGEGKIFPIKRQSVNDNILNAGSGYNPLSTIENIPHAYTTPSSIKSNYSRRWRGIEGTAHSPFDIDMFGFGFESPALDFPFLSGFYDFDTIEGSYVKSRSLGDVFGKASGLLSSSAEVYKNIGWRFSSGTLFNDELPGYSGAYKTSDWTALASGSSNFQSHELYGQISDAFNNVIRISGHSQNINFSNIETTSGFAIFTRFTPDANVSGTTYNLFNSGVLFSKWDTAADMDFALGYDGGYLCGYAKDIAGNTVTVKDTIKYSGYQFPLSVILTYNDHQSSGLKLYTDNELHSGDLTTLRASSSPFNKNPTTANLVLGHCPGSGVGMNMLVSEFGISTYQAGSGTNIVESSADQTHKQVTAQKFLEGHRVKLWEPGQSVDVDTYKLPYYVDEDTYADWTIGDFKYCQFGTAFSQLSQRPGRDLISFNLKHDGLGYLTRNDLSLPTNVDSGVSYHTQLENDFLRFHLSDTSNNFYSVHKRISKNLPYGYKFADRALVVETVIEHTASGDIVWPECDNAVGPKLIVSLYTPKQEPYWNPTEPNWGLVNRDVHYLEPSSCLMRLDSKFTYDSWVDDSENWALFPSEPRMKEFEEKYFSQDVDDMFLQYDLVYPSGSAFESKIEIHTAHVRMDDAYVTASSDSGNMNLMASGGKVEDENLSLSLIGPGSFSGWPPLNLNVLGPSGLSSSGFPIFISGQCSAYNYLNLNVLSYITTSSGINLVTSGELGIPNSSLFNMNVHGIGRASSIMPFVAFNSETSYIPGLTSMPLFTWAVSGWAESGILGIRKSMPIMLHNAHQPHPTHASGELNLSTLGSSPLASRYPYESMPIFMSVDHPLIVDTNVNLTLYGEAITTPVSNSGMKLYVANYGGVGSDYLRWFNNNIGTAIQVQDNSYASVLADNDIRGVELMGYGSCSSDSTKKTIDQAIITDETVWRPETCNEGGIFRAINTYTNSTTAGFGDTVGYSGNYYGIRKYTGLVPGSPYLSTLKIVTGSTAAIKTPRNFEDWEYGTCGSYFGADACCTSDCDQNLAYSGVKLIGDDPYLSGDPTITPPSGRNTGDNYGKSVSVATDLMVVGSPFTDIPDASGHELPDAGTAYLYRRQADVAGLKANWHMQNKLMLPSGVRRDYISASVDKLIEYDQFSISGKKWNIGQEGRQFGHSVDICSSGDRETVIIGAPSAKWTRTFPEISTSGIPVCMFVLCDNLTSKNYNEREVRSVATAANKFNILYKYFTAPWKEEFQPRLDVKVIVCHLTNTDEEDIDHQHGDWFHHRYIGRVDTAAPSEKPKIFANMVQGIKDAFFEMFPSGKAAPHSGIPPIVGIFQDNSPSLDRAFTFNNKHVVDEFIDFYEKYSYRSGVINPEVPEARVGHVNRLLERSQNWSSSSTKLITTILDSGYLINTKDNGTSILSFITSGIGQEWAQENAYEFQIPPSSGGRVYVFEKESGVFNCVQEIKSYSDRVA